MRMPIELKARGLALMAALASAMAYSTLAIWSSPSYSYEDDPRFCYEGWVLISRQFDSSGESCNYECPDDGRVINAPCDDLLPE